MRGRGRPASTPLAGRVALITGTPSTISVATARLLADEGARVALTASPSASARFDALATQIQGTGGQILSFPADLGTRARARALVRRVIEEWGRLDILVVAGGYDATAGLPTAGATTRPRIGQPHPAVRGLLHVATAALPPMERRGGGDIVVIAPVAGHVLRGGAGDLGSARIALEIAALCDNLRWRGGSRGARVAVVEPGAVVVEAGVSGAGSQPATQDGASWAPLHARCGPVHMTAFQPCLWA